MTTKKTWTDLDPEVNAGRVVAVEVEVYEHGRGYAGEELVAVQPEGADEAGHQQPAAVGGQEGGAQHGVVAAVTHHPDQTRPDQQHKAQPRRVGDAPHLRTDTEADTDR